MYIYLYMCRGRSVRLFRPGPKPIDADRFLFSFRDRCETENAGIYTEMKIAGHPAQHAHTRMQTQTRKHSTKAGLARPYYHFFIFYISISLFVLSLLFFQFLTLDSFLTTTKRWSEHSTTIFWYANQLVKKKKKRKKRRNNPKMIRSPLFTSRPNISEQQYIDDSAENICVHLYFTDGKTCFLIFFYMRIINFLRWKRFVHFHYTNI